MLEKDFYQQDALTVARELVGCYLHRKVEDSELVARVVETEAYLGPEDKASHAYNNKRTERTEIMFEPGGYVYVYLIYGLHHCFNIVCGPKDSPEAVFIRAVEPINGLETMKENRDIKSSRIEELSNGPGKLTQALDIDKSFNGYDLIEGDRLYIREDNNKENLEIVADKRVNIDYAKEYKDKPWRFYIKGNSFVSV